MGTRADFYVGRGPDAEWLGSIAFDGYPDGIDKRVFGCGEESLWREEVGKLLAERKDGTMPEHGWPWPWKDSRTTDYAYAFDGGRVWASCFGHEWFDPLNPPPDNEDGDSHFMGAKGGEQMFPNMEDRSRVTSGPRSGLLIFTKPKD